MVVGPWIGLNMARWEAFNLAFWLCTGVAAVGIILSLIMTVPPVISHADGSTPKMGFAAMFDRAALPFAMVTFFYDLFVCRGFCFSGALCTRT